MFGSDAFSRRMTEFLASAGKRPDDLEFASAADPSGALAAEVGVFRVRGVDAPALRDAIVESSRPGAPGLTTAPATLAGKAVTKLVYASGTMLYLYPRDELVFYVGAASEEAASQVLAELR